MNKKANKLSSFPKVREVQAADNNATVDRRAGAIAAAD